MVYNDGYVGYNKTDEEKVNQFIMEIVKELAAEQAKSYIPEPRVWFAPPYHSYLTERFKASKISFSIKVIDGKEHIIWEDKDREIADLIVKQFVKDLEDGVLPSNKAAQQ